MESSRSFLLVVALVVLLTASASGEEPAADPPSTVWVEPGTVIWDRPGAHGREVTRVQTVAELPVTEVTRGWMRVVYLDRSGWIERPEVGEGGRSPTDSPCAQIDLDSALRCVDLGWVWLVTDLDAAQSVGVERLLTELPSRYRLRYGAFDLDGDSTAWFAVLRRRQDYDAFLEQYRHRLAVDASAVASGRVAAMVFDAAGPPLEAVVTHEGAHLINRVALGEGVPVWLEEGSAGCLGLITDEGSVAGRTNSVPVLVYHDAGWSEEQTQVAHAGPRAAVVRLRAQASAGQLSLESVLGVERASFYRSPDRQQNYELSSLLTCYLAESVFPVASGGLVRAWHDSTIAAAVDDDWLPAELASWAEELLASLPSAQ